jgi:hypothetical protein
MTYYYLAYDYNGWTIYGTDKVDFPFMDYPFVTTCRDNALKIARLFERRRVPYWEDWDKYSK